MHTYMNFIQSYCGILGPPSMSVPKPIASNFGKLPLYRQQSNRNMQQFHSNTVLTISPENNDFRYMLFPSTKTQFCYSFHYLHLAAHSHSHTQWLSHKGKERLLVGIRNRFHSRYKFTTNQQKRVTFSFGSQYTYATHH